MINLLEFVLRDVVASSLLLGVVDVSMSCDDIVTSTPGVDTVTTKSGDDIVTSTPGDEMVKVT